MIPTWALVIWWAGMPFAGFVALVMDRHQVRHRNQRYDLPMLGVCLMVLWPILLPAWLFAQYVYWPVSQKVVALADRVVDRMEGGESEETLLRPAS